MESSKVDKEEKIEKTDRIIILNAAIDTQKISGRALVSLYKLASVFGKFRNAEIINLNGRGG